MYLLHKHVNRRWSNCAVISLLPASTNSAHLQVYYKCLSEVHWPTTQNMDYVLEPFVATLGMSKRCHFWQPAEATSCQKWQLLDKPINGKRKSQLVSVIGNFCTGLTIAIYGQIRLLPVLARIVLTKWKKWIVCDPFITFRLPRPVVVIVSKFGYIWFPLLFFAEIGAHTSIVKSACQKLPVAECLTIMVHHNTLNNTMSCI